MAVLAAPSYTDPSTGGKVAAAIVGTLLPPGVVLNTTVLAAPGAFTLSNASAGHAI